MNSQGISAMDSFAWVLNVSSAVLLVFVNKQLMDSRNGYGFVYATTLCAFHFLSCAGSVWVAEACGVAERAHLPWKDSLFFAGVASASIASLNISLLVNTVGFYQIAKLLVIPFVCIVEFVWLKRRFTAPVIASVMVVMVGVGIVTVTDTHVTAPGVMVAALSVVASGWQQILCGTYQRKFQMSSHQLLSNTAPVQGTMLLAVGPFLDHWISKSWVWNYYLRVMPTSFIVASCAIAVLVNISQFICLGRFSAVSYQVIGHTKTISVLLIGSMYFHEPLPPRKALGMMMAILGMVMYGFFSSNKKQVVSPKVQEEAALLSKEQDLAPAPSARDVVQIARLHSAPVSSNRG